MYVQTDNSLEERGKPVALDSGQTNSGQYKTTIFSVRGFKQFHIRLNMHYVNRAKTWIETMQSRYCFNMTAIIIVSKLGVGAEGMVI